MAQTLDGLVVQIFVDHFHFVRVQAFHIHAKAVILRCDADRMVLKIFDRMIGAVMAEFHFVCFPAEREADDLVP